MSTTNQILKKESLLKEIGNFFGDFSVKNGTYRIDNGETIFSYDSVDAALVDWLETLKQHDKALDEPIWSDAISYICANCCAG